MTMLSPANISLLAEKLGFPGLSPDTQRKVVEKFAAVAIADALAAMESKLTADDRKRALSLIESEDAEGLVSFLSSRSPVFTERLRQTFSL